MGGSRAWVHYVGYIFLWLETAQVFFFPETLQELISHLSVIYTVHGSIIIDMYCFTVIIIYYIPCSSLHHSHHLASRLVWVPAPLQEGGRGWALRLLPISVFSPPSSSPLPLAPFSLGRSRRRADVIPSRGTDIVK